VKNHVLRQVGRNVADARAEARISQYELDALLGENDGFIESLEAGEVEPTMLHIIEIARHARVPAASLLAGLESAPSGFRETMGER
jgi:ribosome-binding protein aMBF1 (putative translation factor)